MKPSLPTACLWLKAAIVLAGASLFAAACSGDGGGGKAHKPTAEPEKTEWAIHVYVGPPGSAKRVDLGPVKEVSFPEGSARGGALAGLPGSPNDLWKGPPGSAPEGKKPTGPGSKPQATVGGADGSVTFDQDLTDGQNGWALVWGAAV